MLSQSLLVDQISLGVHTTYVQYVTEPTLAPLLTPIVADERIGMPELVLRLQERHLLHVLLAAHRLEYFEPVRHGLSIGPLDGRKPGSPISMAAKPLRLSSAMTLDFPVPDMSVNTTRFMVVSPLCATLSALCRVERPSKQSTPIYKQMLAGSRARFTAQTHRSH